MEAGEQIENPQLEVPKSTELYDKFPLQKLDFTRGKVAFRDMRPDEPRPNGGEIPIVMMVGWLMNQDSIVNSATTLVDRYNQHTIPLDFVGGGNLWDFTLKPQAEIERQADILHEWLQTRTEPKVNIMGISKSALVVIELLKRHSEDVSKLNAMIIAQGIGISGEDTPDDLKARKKEEDKRNAQRPKTAEDRQLEPVISKMWKLAMARHPIRTYKEGYAMAEADEYAALEGIQNMGVKVVAIQAVDDKLATAERFFGQVGEGFESPMKPVDPQNAKPGQKFEYVPPDRKPPFNNIRMLQGGHETMARVKYAGTIVGALERANSPLDKGDVVKFTQSAHKEPEGQTPSSNANTNHS